MQTPHMRDLAISAVSYDACLVAELTALLSARIGGQPIWAGERDTLPDVVAVPLHEHESRVVLVLPQRLWGHDRITSCETEVLRARAGRMPRSLVVVALDDEPLPQWMRKLRPMALAAEGVDGVVDHVLRAVTEAGGLVTPKAARRPGDAPPAPWPDPPPPYLRQPRAHSALRRELDSLCDAVEAPFDARDRSYGGPQVEMRKLPNRIVARVDGVGVSFSWVPGRTGLVADGRLMVIEWSDVEPSGGRTAFRAARPTRERVYSVEAMSPDEWYWRADGPNGRASSTANLVGEWMDGATMTAALQRW